MEPCNSAAPPLPSAAPRAKILDPAPAPGLVGPRSRSDPACRSGRSRSAADQACTKYWIRSPSLFSCHRSRIRATSPASTDRPTVQSAARPPHVAGLPTMDFRPRCEDGTL